MRIRRCRLNLFDEMLCLDSPDRSRLPDGQQLARLNELFEQAHDTNVPLRAMLFSLRSLDVVRIIEEPLSRNTTTLAPEP